MKKTRTQKFDLSGWLFELLWKLRLKSNLYLFNPIIRVYCWMNKIKVGKNVKFNGYPIIRRYPNSLISLGSGCKFNSSKRSVRILLKKRCEFITISKQAEIIIGEYSGATGVTIVASNGVYIGKNVLIGLYSTIFDNDFHNSDPRNREQPDLSARPVQIEDNVFVGFNCTILKGVRIGKNSVIGANSVVNKDIPPNCIALGNPCKVLIRRNWEDSID